MKRNTVTNILKEFNSANDKVHYISKHNGHWNKPAWELRYGLLYHENNLIGKCNSILNVVINYYNTNEIEYRCIYRKGRNWWNVDKITNNYNLSKDSITNYESNIESIIEDLLFGIYYRTVSLKLKLENYLSRNKYARLKSLKLEYDLCKKALSRIRIDISHWCEKYSINFDGVYYYDRKFWWGEYVDYRYNYYNTYLKGDTNNIKNIILSQNLRRLLNAKIYYWDNCRKGIFKDKHIPFKKFLEIWKNPNNKIIFKKEVSNAIEKIKIEFEERERYKKNTVLQVLPLWIEKFRTREIDIIPYDISKYINEVFVRKDIDSTCIEFSNGWHMTIETFNEIISLITACVFNNITLSEKVCNNRNIKVGNTRVQEIDNSEFWSITLDIGRLSYMEMIKYCTDNHITVCNNKVSKYSILKKYSRV